MSTSADLVAILKKELKTAQMTYADLAQALGLAESSVKRMLARGDMPLSRIDAICRVLKTDFAELSRQVADAQPLSAAASSTVSTAPTAVEALSPWREAWRERIDCAAQPVESDRRHHRHPRGARSPGPREAR